jgi:cell division protein FtsX
VEKLNSGLGGKALRDVLDDWGSKDAWSGSASKFLSDHGISLTTEELASLAADARVQKQADVLQSAVTRPEMNEAWLQKYSKILTLNDALEALASKSAKGEWLTKGIRDKVEASGLLASELPGLAQRLRYVQSTEAAQNQLMAEYGQGEGIGANAVWLIVVSLLVCVVGISNAMLISVLERFREIATMKCLGALNGLIATLFLLEAAFLGAVGGVAGVVIGAVLGLARMFAGYGAWVATFFPYLGLVGVAGVSILTGMLLTTLAAIYPAFRAAKMPPMEAMRVE